MATDRTLLATLKSEYDEAYTHAGDLARDLAAARARRDELRSKLMAALQASRAAGMTWEQIGDELGITAQAASQWFKRGAAAGV